MGILNKYRVVIAVVLPILILVLIKSLGTNSFRGDAKRWAEPSAMKSNIISEEQIGMLPGDKLVIILNEKDGMNDAILGSSLKIRADSILLRTNLNKIRKHNGPVLLFSSDTAVSARIWMILSQMGFKNIYILTGDQDNEVLKSKFQPDTIVRLEI